MFIHSCLYHPFNCPFCLWTDRQASCVFSSLMPSSFSLQHTTLSFHHYFFPWRWEIIDLQNEPFISPQMLTDLMNISHILFYLLSYVWLVYAALWGNLVAVTAVHIYVPLSPTGNWEAYSMRVITPSYFWALHILPQWMNPPVSPLWEQLWHFPWLIEQFLHLFYLSLYCDWNIETLEHWVLSQTSFHNGHNIIIPCTDPGSKLVHLIHDTPCIGINAL